MNYRTTTDVAQMLAVFDSVSAHLAAKLELFDTDERTLTDELCDMSCIWFGIPAAQFRQPVSQVTNLPQIPFQIELAKTTSREEAQNGADLRLVLFTPSGIKAALFQAKVLDPRSLRLRCDSKAGWAKLRKQLKAMQKYPRILHFLLLYGPAGQLDGQDHGYGTYEQGILNIQATTTSSRYGASVIPVNSMLGPTGKWIQRRHPIHSGAGRFIPANIPFSIAILEMLVCRRGSWIDKADLLESDFPTTYTLTVTVSEISQSAWEELQTAVRRALDHTNGESATGAG
jgi:hypothetical protein